jgi:predicted Zn-dependent protease
LVASVLRIWSDYWPSPQRVDDARSLAVRTAAVEQKLVYAAFLSRAGRPADAIRLAAPAAALPVSAESAEANAVLGDALSRSGNVAAAKSRFDAVIAFDPGNSTALRGRSELDLRTGKVAAAIVDAQKLVTVLPSSPGDRLLLARCYAAAGNNAWAERTLWTAFQDIPADETIYNALLATKNGNEEATRELQEEFDRQREASVSRGLV